MTELERAVRAILVPAAVIGGMTVDDVLMRLRRAGYVVSPPVAFAALQAQGVLNGFGRWQAPEGSSEWPGEGDRLVIPRERFEGMSLGWRRALVGLVTDPSWVSAESLIAK